MWDSISFHNAKAKKITKGTQGSPSEHSRLGQLSGRGYSIGIGNKSWINSKASSAYSNIASF